MVQGHRDFPKQSCKDECKEREREKGIKGEGRIGKERRWVTT